MTITQQVTLINEQINQAYSPLNGYTFKYDGDGTFGAFKVTSGDLSVTVEVELYEGFIRYGETFQTDSTLTRQQNFQRHSMLMNVWGNIESFNSMVPHLTTPAQ